MITFNGRSSSEFEGLRVRKVETSVLPSVQEHTASVPMRHGVIDYGRTYGSREINVTFGFIAKNDEALRKLVRDVANWLDSPKPKPFINGDEPDKQYLARVTGDTALSPEYLYEEATVTFMCPDPFARSITYNHNTVISAEVSSINYHGTFEVFPTITVNITEASNEVSFTVHSDYNDEETVLTLDDNFASGDTVVVDCEEGKVTVNGSPVNILTLDSDYFALQKGANTITMTGAAQADVSYQNVYL